MADIQDGAGEAQVSCPACHKPNRAGQKFCRHCGVSMASVAAVTPAALGPECPECGALNKSEAKFCRACGESLSPQIPADQEIAAEPKPNPEPEPETQEQATAPWLQATWIKNWAILLLKRKAKAAIAGQLVTGAIGLLILIGGGYALWSTVARNDAMPEMAETGDTVPGEAPAEVPISAALEPAPSVLTGTYSAHLADQDITLTVIGPPAPLPQIGAIITYSNVVVGGGCGSALEPETGRNTLPANTVTLKFQQVTVAGQPACPSAIPISLDVSEQMVDSDGVIQSVQATWLNPETGDVLMTGQLTRIAAQ